MIDRLDHFVLTTAQPEEIIRFYTEVLGMKLETFRNGQRQALKFGKQKINIHVKGREYEPKAHAPGVGTLDFCFIASVPLEQVIASLEKHKVAIIEGPCIKTGAMGDIRSVYFRDPDFNLVEVSEYV
ncbi:MAG: VOC family protein [Betaproteobacteria bacterium]|jgi:catechol 2,3-dioxygenase-like lactoylglutathione lyase family enzyme|nr:VOC family protein [Betaproteobacteria bacterium]MDH5343800.1 VOC family protein [Betaproteobacteria bacterium]